MTIQQAIEKAIEGGYKWHGGPRECSWGHYDHAFIDPLFWSSLGKAMGWKKWCWRSYKGRNDHNLTEFTDEEEHDITWPYAEREATWKWNWHRFIDHLAEGKDAESFFDSLDK